MKANLSRPLALALALPAVLALASSCSAPRVLPTPAPTPAPQPQAPLLTPPAQANWRDAPITPGDWTWSMAGGQSVATFANGLLKLSCDRANATVVLDRRGNASGTVPVRITTAATTRALTGTGVPAPAPAIRITLAARDPLLDAMAFSRGRFALDTAGLQTLYVPSWPEVSRGDRGLPLKLIAKPLITARTVDSDGKKNLCKSCCAARNRSNIMARPDGTAPPPQPGNRRFGSTARKEVTRCLMVQQRGRQFPSRSIIAEDTKVSSKGFAGGTSRPLTM